MSSYSHGVRRLASGSGFYWWGPACARARTRALDPHAQGALDAQRSLIADELQDDVENHDGRLVARDEEVEHRRSPCGTAATGGLQSISMELTSMRLIRGRCAATERMRQLAVPISGDQGRRALVLAH